MTPKFCNSLSNEINFTLDTVKPCGWFRAKTMPVTVESLNKLKEYAASSDWIPECSHCYNLESKQIKSPRNRANDNRLGIFSNSDEVGVPKRVDFQIDTDCNAACLMCSTHFSSTWRKYTENHIIDANEINKRDTNTFDDRLDIILSNIDLSNVQLVKISGGEPFKNDLHLKILEKIENLKNLTLIYVSNGSYLPNQKTLDVWKKCKKIEIYFSIDGIEIHFNYLRWPLQWSRVSNNLKYLSNLDIDNMQIGTSFALTPFNIYYVDRYKSWAHTFFKDSKNTDPKYWFIEPFVSSGVINLSCITPSLRTAIQEKYGESHELYKLIPDFNREAYEKFINYVSLHDLKRSHDWRIIFPEIVPYINT